MYKFELGALRIKSQLNSLRIKWNFELTVFELTVPDLYYETKWCNSYSNVTAVKRIGYKRISTDMSKVWEKLDITQVHLNQQSLTIFVKSTSKFSATKKGQVTPNNQTISHPKSLSTEAASESVTK